jgi:flagellar biosynthesis/type III secretory pathway protein FliH
MTEKIPMKAQPTQADLSAGWYIANRFGRAYSEQQMTEFAEAIAQSRAEAYEEGVQAGKASQGNWLDTVGKYAEDSGIARALDTIDKGKE